MEDNKQLALLDNDKLALINKVINAPITKEVVSSDDFSMVWNYLTSFKEYIDSAIDTAKEEVKNVVKDNYFATGESSIVNNGYRYTYIPETSRETFNSKALKEDDPELYKKYVKVSSVKETFKATPIKKKEEKPDIIEATVEEK